MEEFLPDFAGKDRLTGDQLNFWEQLNAMLGHLHPAGIDRARASVRVDEKKCLRVDLPHRAVPELRISVRAELEGKIVLSLGPTRKRFRAYDFRSDYPIDLPDDRWLIEAVNAIAAFLQGEYVLETHYRGNTPCIRKIYSAGNGGEKTLLASRRIPVRAAGALNPFAPKRAEAVRVGFFSSWPPPSPQRWPGRRW